MKLLWIALPLFGAPLNSARHVEATNLWQPWNRYGRRERQAWLRKVAR